MVSAVNKLFLRSKPSFLFDHILLLRSIRLKKSAYEVYLPAKTVAPLNFWLAEGESLSTGNYELMVSQQAMQIRGLGQPVTINKLG